MTSEEASVLVRLIEAATDGNWPRTRRALLDEAGYEPEEIVKACKALTDLAHVSPIIELGDL